MSKDNLGSKQTNLLHNCLMKKEIYFIEEVITTHRQKLGYTRSKRQTRKKTIIAK